MEQVVNRGFIFNLDNRSNEVQNKNLNNWNCIVIIILGEEMLG